MWDVTRRLGQVTGHATNRLAELLGGQTPVLLDGGMGTLLQDLGLEGGGAGELWNVERPDAIREVHEAYAEAGARILTTNTFGGTRPRLQMHGLEDRVHELNEAAATIARSVADAHGILVAGDLGPTGRADGAAGHHGRRPGDGVLRRGARGSRGRRDRCRPDRDHERPGRGRGRHGGGADGRPRAAGHRDDELRHQPAHDDGRPSRRRRRPARGGRSRRGRRELRTRPRRHGCDRGRPG